MITTTIFLIRHGETDANRNQVYQGQAGDGLNALGREQALRLAARLADVGVRFDALYSSDLARAFETAEIVGDCLRVTPIPEPGLREVYLGAWQGLSYTDVEAQFPDEVAAWRRGEDIRRGGGESYADLQARMLATLDRLALGHAGGVVGAVSHGAAIKLFIAAVLSIPMTHLRHYHVVVNTAVTVVRRVEGEPWEMLVWNDARHLPGDPLGGALVEDA